MVEADTEFDSPWKEILEAYFEDFLQFFFPAVHALIDWQQGYEFLDKELQQVVRDAELGRRLLDKLVKVYRRDGQALHLYIHVEIQGQYEQDFARRMFTYHYRLFDKYGQRVVSLAILGDERKQWRPDGFNYALAGCFLDFRFPIAKLLDWQDEWEWLEQARNPFGVIVRIHLKALETRRKPKKRLEWKFSLFKALYEADHTREDILRLFHFLDWVMFLPGMMEQEFDKLILEFEKEKNMPYITRIERRGIEKGIAQGFAQGIEQGIEQGIGQGMLRKSREAIATVLSTRFGPLPRAIRETLETLDAPELLSELLKEAAIVESLAVFEVKLAGKQSGPGRH